MCGIGLLQLVQGVFHPVFDSLFNATGIIEIVVLYKYFYGIERNYTFCFSLPENILLFTQTSNLLTTCVDTQPFASKGTP